jgi:phosphatidylserine/phosphatidylglycerophosphate/cardiolipin synthase-like enzyme
VLVRVLDEASRKAVQEAIAQNASRLEQTPGFVAAEPGFPIVDGAVLKEPAVIVYVAEKKAPDHLLPEERMPRQLGPYRVAVMQADPLQQIARAEPAAGLAAAVTTAITDLTYEGLAGNPIDKVHDVARPIVCHVGPDAGWSTLRPFLEATEEKLTVAMYDFNAAHIATAVIALVLRNEIDMKLTWDDSMTADETAVRKKLRTKLEGRLEGGIVLCGGGRRFASAYHEKVAVRDSSAFWLSSGNWSRRSQPDIDPLGDPADRKGMYSKGNREWHIIVEDEPLAKLFERYIEHDLKGSQDEAQAGAAGAVLAAGERLRLPDVFVPIDALVGEAIEMAAPAEPVVPAVLPDHGRPFKVRPLLSPDNYRERIVELLKSAKRSVYLQFSYINHSKDKAADKDYLAMLGVLADLSYKPGMDLRIIVGSGSADKIRRLVQSGFNEQAFRTQSNIHNKGIIVDGKAVLVSSANWSPDGVLRNRDAGVIIYDEQVAKYFQDIFVDDWESRANPRIPDDTPVLVAPDDAPTPPGMVRMTWRDYHGE